MAQEPNQDEINRYFKAMAEGKLQGEDVYAIGKPVGGRSSRVIHYRMNYPNGPANLPVQNVTSEVAQMVDQAKAQTGIKIQHRHKRHKSSSDTPRDHIKKKGVRKRQKRKRLSKLKWLQFIQNPQPFLGTKMLM